MAKIAPTIPSNLPPIKMESKIKKLGMPTIFLVKSGVKILLSICWIIKQMIAAQNALTHESRKATKTKIAPETIGPRKGRMFRAPASKDKEKVNLIFNKQQVKKVSKATPIEHKILLPNQLETLFWLLSQSLRMFSSQSFGEIVLSNFKISSFSMEKNKAKAKIVVPAKILPKRKGQNLHESN